MEAQQKISATIITLNEEKNIGRAIDSLKPFVDEIIVVDSGSQDRTLEIAQSKGAKTFNNAWRGYGAQKNFAQQKASHDWVINIDADEAMTPELAEELKREITATSQNGMVIKGFVVPRKTYYVGKWIAHGGWYPNHLPRVSHKSHSRWTEPAVHEVLEIQGGTKTLVNPILHYTFDSVSEQVERNIRYAQYGAAELQKKACEPSLMRLILKPIGKFLETYLIKQGFRDGMRGLIISVNAAHSMFMKFAFLYEKSWKKDRPS